MGSIMQSIDLGQDDGVVTITFDGISRDIDIVHCWESYLDWSKDNAKVSPFTSTLPAFMESLGFPRASERVALRFVNVLAKLSDECKKKDDGWRASAVSITSGPDPSDPTEASSPETPSS